MDGTGDGMHRIGAAEIGPAVAAGAGHPDAEPPAAECLIRNAINSAAIDGDEITMSSFPRRSRKDVAYATQISFALFSHVCDSDNRSSEVNPCLPCRAQRPQQRHQPATVVGDTWHEDGLVFPAKLEGCFQGEDGIKVRGENDRITAETLVSRDDVSHRVYRRLQAD